MPTSPYLCLTTHYSDRLYREGIVYGFESDPGSFFALTADTKSRGASVFTEDINGTSYLPRPGWDDLRFPTQAINPPGAVSDPDRDTADGTYLFDAGATEMLTGGTVIPHSWAQGTELRPHLHWAPTTTGTGNVVWKLEYRIATPGEALGDWTEDTITVAAGGVASAHHIDSFSRVDMSSVMSTAPYLQWRVSRIGGDAADTYAADAKLLEVDFHYLRDSIGSGEEFRK